MPGRPSGVSSGPSVRSIAASHWHPMHGGREPVQSDGRLAGPAEILRRHDYTRCSHAERLGESVFDERASDLHLG